MSYLQFHLVFIAPPILILIGLHRRRRTPLPGRSWWALAAVALIALVYTTPWDNYLVWRGVWDYGPERVIGTIGYVPVEEYLFFVLQPLLTGLVLLLGFPAARMTAAPASRWLGAVLYGSMFLAGIFLLQRTSGTYLGLILVWAAPVLSLQWAYAGREIWSRRRVWGWGVAVPTLYLWIADGVAIRAGVWRISETYTLGPAVGPLPLEEAVFFLLTNLLVVQGLFLFVHPPDRDAEREERPYRRGMGVETVPESGRPMGGATRASRSTDDRHRLESFPAQERPASSGRAECGG